MQKTIKYLGIDNVTYKFSENDIRNALIKYFNIDTKGCKIEFEIWESWVEERTEKLRPAGAELITKKKVLEEEK